MTEDRTRKVANSESTKEVKHVNDLLKKKKSDKGERRYAEEKQ